MKRYMYYRPVRAPQFTITFITVSLLLLRDPCFTCSNDAAQQKAHVLCSNLVLE